MSTMIKFGILLISIDNSSRHEVIVDRILFGVEHDEIYDTMDQTVSDWGSCCFRSATALDMKSSCSSILFGVEHDERCDPWVQTMICLVISLPLIENPRHDAIIHCSLFGVKHDESHRTFKSDEKHDELDDPFVSNWGPFCPSLQPDGNEQISNTTLMVFIPLALMLDRSVNTFTCAHKDVLKAETLVRQLTCRQEQN